MRLHLSPHGLQQHGLRGVVLEDDRVALLVRRDFGRERHLALALALRVYTQLDYRERVIDRARAVLGFPDTDVAVARHADAYAGIRLRRLPRALQILIN